MSQDTRIRRGVRCSARTREILDGLDKLETVGPPSLLRVLLFPNDSSDMKLMKPGMKVAYTNGKRTFLGEVKEVGHGSFWAVFGGDTRGIGGTLVAIDRGRFVLEISYDDPNIRVLI